MSNFFVEKQVRVRKPHKCEWCCETIEIGTAGVACRGSFEGYFYHYYLRPE